MRSWRAACLTMAALGVAAAASGFAAAEAVVVRNLTVTDGTVSGDLVNTSHRLVRDVRLLVRYTSLWERPPGEESAGWAAYPTVHHGDIRPGGSRFFSVRVDPPLPVGSDGRFETAVEVVGFTEMAD